MIARTRKRPRIASSAWRTLWWLVKIEGQLRVLYPSVADVRGHDCRMWWYELPSATRAYRVERFLATSPSRRFTR